MHSGSEADPEEPGALPAGQVGRWQWEKGSESWPPGWESLPLQAP